MRKTRPELPSDRVFYCLNQCAPGGIRTPNLLIRSQMLYPLSYGRASTRSQPDDYIRAEAGVRTALERTASGPGCPPGSRTRCVGKRSARAGRLGVGVVDGVGGDDRVGVASRACRSAAARGAGALACGDTVTVGGATRLGARGRRPAQVGTDARLARVAHTLFVLVHVDLLLPRACTATVPAAPGLTAASGRRRRPRNAARRPARTREYPANRSASSPCRDARPRPSLRLAARVVSPHEGEQSTRGTQMTITAPQITTSTTARATVRSIS